MTDNEKLERKIDRMMADKDEDIDDIIKTVNKIEGTHGDRYLLSVLVAEVNKLKENLEQATERIKSLENINESLSESYKNRNDRWPTY